MNKSSALFVCSTNYTILNAINIVENNLLNTKGCSDLVVFMRNKSMEKYVDRLIKEKIFNNVFVYDFINSFNGLKKACILFNPAKFLKKYVYSGYSACEFKEKYDLMISQSVMYNSIFQRVWKDINIYMMEEGLSSYTSRTISPSKRSFFFKIFNKFCNKTSRNEIIGQILYYPELFQGNSLTLKLIKLPNITSHVFKVVESIFSGQTNRIYNEFDSVYLGTPLFGLKGLMNAKKKIDANFEKKTEKLLVKALSLIGGKIIYRKHPLERNIDFFDKEIMVLDDVNNMWEIEVFNSINESTLLISFFSTAAITPKILYGKEPYLLFLYKLLEKDFYNAENIVNSLKNIYINPSKIMIPANINELKKCINEMNKGTLCI